jgi:hypothetical protein
LKNINSKKLIKIGENKRNIKILLMIIIVNILLITLDLLKMLIEK